MIELSDSDLIILYFALDGCIANLLNGGFSPERPTLKSRMELLERLHSYLFHTGDDFIPLSMDKVVSIADLEAHDAAEG